MGGMIYVGVVEKVSWNYAGGYLGMRPYANDKFSDTVFKKLNCQVLNWRHNISNKGGTAAVLIIVILIGRHKDKKAEKKVKNDDLEMNFTDFGEHNEEPE